MHTDTHIHIHTHAHTHTQARAPHSPVIIVGTHLDKITSRAQKMEMNRCIEYIDSTYGSREARREGYPQVSCVACQLVGHWSHDIVCHITRENSVFTSRNFALMPVSHGCHMTVQCISVVVT